MTGGAGGAACHLDDVTVGVADSAALTIASGTSVAAVSGGGGGIGTSDECVVVAALNGVTGGGHRSEGSASGVGGADGNTFGVGGILGVGAGASGLYLGAVGLTQSTAESTTSGTTVHAVNVGEGRRGKGYTSVVGTTFVRVTAGDEHTSGHHGGITREVGTCKFACCGSGILVGGAT